MFSICFHVIMFVNSHNIFLFCNIYIHIYIFIHIFLFSIPFFTVDDGLLVRMLMGSGLGLALTKDGNPLSLHYVMFLPALVGQATQEQLSYWMSRAWAGDVIGTYAQVCVYV